VLYNIHSDSEKKYAFWQNKSLKNDLKSRQILKNFKKPVFQTIWPNMKNSTDRDVLPLFFGQQIVSGLHQQ
jgi:hypothetical protein